MPKRKEPHRSSSAPLHNVQNNLFTMFSSMYTTVAKEMIDHELLILNDGDLLELPQHLIGPMATIPLLESLTDWSELTFQTNDGRIATIDMNKWFTIEESERVTIQTHIQGLITASKLIPSWENIPFDFQSPLTPSAPPLPPSTPTTTPTTTTPVPEENPSPLSLLENLNEMLPPSLKSSPLFMDIVDKIGNEIQNSDLLPKIEDVLKKSTIKKEPKPKGTTAEGEEEEEEEEEEPDPDLPDLASLTDEMRKRIEEESKTESQEKLDPMFLMNMTKTLFNPSGENIDPDQQAIAAGLKSIAEKISGQIKDKVSSGEIHPDAIKSDLASAISFMGNFTLKGPTDKPK